MWTVRGAEVMIDIYFFYINSVVFVSCRQNETASFVFGDCVVFIFWIKRSAVKLY